MHLISGVQLDYREKGLSAPLLIFKYGAQLDYVQRKYIPEL